LLCGISSLRAPGSFLVLRVRDRAPFLVNTFSQRSSRLPRPAFHFKISRISCHYPPPPIKGTFFPFLELSLTRVLDPSVQSRSVPASNFHTSPEPPVIILSLHICLVFMFRRSTPDSPRNVRFSPHVLHPQTYRAPVIRFLTPLNPHPTAFKRLSLPGNHFCVSHSP